MASKRDAVKQDSGVSLPRGTSGSKLFALLLEDTVSAFPGAFGSFHLPAGEKFRKGYPELVTQFEALRAASPQRSQIALFLARRQLQSFEFVVGDSSRPMLEIFEAHAEPFPLSRGANPQTPLPIVEVPYRQATHKGGEVALLANDFLERHGATKAAVKALHWIANEGGSTGHLDLSQLSFAILGASAEIAPTEALIHAGARILWIDIKEPPAALQRPNVQWVKGGADLLSAPSRIGQTIVKFSEGKPVNLVACAYAPGRGREWRLAVAMSAIAHKLPAGILASLILLLSPTSSCVTEPEDVEAVQVRAKKAHLWQTALGVARVLGPPLVKMGSVSVARSIVPMQGATYQAAQYAAKRITAEAFAMYGPGLDEKNPRPLLVSANVAPITRTRSLKHPLFEAAFLGAPTFGVEIFDPPATRAIGLLLALHDLLNPASVNHGTKNAADLFRQQVHSAIYGLPWALAPSITASALLGLGMRPKILLKMF